MSWEGYRSVMESHVIKMDDMATEDAYFMATHMPFEQLEVYQGGKTTTPPKLKNEDEVFEELICNPENEHRMIIVRGDNGTGKSHLIRYLKAKFENSPSTIYDPEKEQLVFLRRLNNSVRGVFAQLLQQDVIIDQDIEEKLKKFIDSTDALGEEEFKTKILYAYVTAVSNDSSGRDYKPVLCRGIASYLSDSRVKEYLMREGGPISRCYELITAPSGQVLHSTAVFKENDFNVASIIRGVCRQGDPRAVDFATTLRDDDAEVIHLVRYLNQLSRDVVKSCADISSESTKAVFELLRRDLKKQGKSLTLFIEDFTGFTGIDSELITVLSTEHGGDYADLCRVTSVIGITNDYYDQFRDNFTDRVTHQISVTEKSFGTDDFLIQMTGRYLNAIYCEPGAIQTWYDNGALPDELPASKVLPPCLWETTIVGRREMTLYPFNRKAICALYGSLPVKSPRMFLRDVIRAQMKEYFDGKAYGDEWVFPLNPAYIQMSRDQHSSAIDRLQYLNDKEKDRLKSVLAIWGDGSAEGMRREDGTILFGGLDRAFLTDIGLAAFQGIGDIKTYSVAEPPIPEGGATEMIGDQGSLSTSVHMGRKVTDTAHRDYELFVKDITAWFTGGAELKYHADYRKLLRGFLCGDNRVCGAINWQDIGVPAYIASERLDIRSIYVEGQGDVGDADKAIVYLDRSVESRDVLRALIEMQYAKGWDFESSAYYQQRLITWLERHKRAIIDKVCAIMNGERPRVLEWCLCLQYLRTLILGVPVDDSDPVQLFKGLFERSDRSGGRQRETREWDELIQFVLNRNDEFETSLLLLQNASATVMGTIQRTGDQEERCYRTDELLADLTRLKDNGWDVERELPDNIPAKHLLYNPAALLKSLYPRIKAVMKAEQAMASDVLGKLEEYIGGLNKTELTATIHSIQNLFSAFNMNGVLGYNELRVRYDGSPADVADKIMEKIGIVESITTDSPIRQMAVLSTQALNDLAGFLRDLQSIERLAEQEEDRAEKERKRIRNIPELDQLSDAALEKMRELYEQLEGMEVYDGAIE